MITIDEFKKVELRVAKVLSCERIEGSDKLLKMAIDCGEPRTLVAGIGKKYTPEDMVGKLVVVAYNLESRMLMGIESQGMILCADADGGPVVLAPVEHVLPGSKIC